ncbi:hypothetical protein [Geomicrobium sediminis]|uniref:Uncharacterized protein n=1 Tax=Geomicrobium sediminis TaxID=1347788 RepID=A0ABS2PGC8_9BACL|nr:hypothetical protein [Geomicrobium sediminis]MBM7633883.1 hypothetical protein [Geomicrobium sediminis]
MFTTVQFWVVIWIGLDLKFRKLNIVTESTDVKDVETLFYQKLEQEMYREIMEIVEVTRRKEIQIEEE